MLSKLTLVCAFFAQQVGDDVSQHCSKDSRIRSLEEALGMKDKAIAQLRSSLFEEESQHAQVVKTSLFYC